MKQKILLLSLSSLILCSCGGSSNPSKGYEKYKQMNSTYLKSIGGSGDEIKYNSCLYVEITGDGLLKAESLKDSVYYCINWTLVLGKQSTSRTVYVNYYPQSDYVVEADSKSYLYAASLVADGSLKGNTGNL